MNPDNALKYINESEVTKPKKWKEPSESELRKRQEEEDRAYFETIRHKFKT